MGQQVQKKWGILLTILYLVLFAYITTVSSYNEGNKTELKTQDGMEFDGINCRVEVTEYIAMLTNLAPGARPCGYTIRKNKDVCQVRLDFTMFSFPSANMEGICDLDRLIVGPSATLAAGITTCGDLGASGRSPAQHRKFMCIGNKDTIDVTPIIMSSSSRYAILVTQIPCSSNKLVPSFCLQYHTDPTGIVRSFDYRTQGQQQSNQKYLICIERPESSSRITWIQCSGADADGVPKPFFVTGPFYRPTFPRPNITGDACTTDWISINGDKKYCGDSFPTSVTTSSRTYSINVNFDQMEMGMPGSITNAADCVYFGQNSEGIWECAWVAYPEEEYNGSCECELNPSAIKAGFDPFANASVPDLGNTGFCLKYQV